MTRRLVHRITIPLVLILLIMGIGLYLFNLRLMSDFADQQIETSLFDLSRHAYGICDENFTDLLQGDHIKDEKSVHIAKALTLDKIEDFMKKNRVGGRIVDKNGDELISYNVPAEAQGSPYDHPSPSATSIVDYGSKKYYVSRTAFEPWTWYISIFKDASEFANLIESARIAYILTGVLLMLSGAVLLHILNRAVKLPVQMIIDYISVGEKPQYKGIGEFEYLSDNIGQMMDAVKESERTIRNIAAGLGEGVYVVDKSGRLIFMNPEAERLLGWMETELLGSFVHDVFHCHKPDNTHLPSHECAILRAIQSGDTYRTEDECFSRKDNSLFAVSYVATPLERDGEIVGAVIAFQDITERKQTESAIKTYTEDLLAINRIIIACTSRLELEAVLEQVLDEVLGIVGLEGGAICLLREDQTLKLAAHRGLPEEAVYHLTHEQVKAGECLCGTCADDGRPVIFPDGESVSRLAKRGVARSADVHFHASFPLIIRSRCLGALCFFTQTERKPTPHSLKLVETAMAQIALGLHNARLYLEVQQQAATLEAKVRHRTAQLESANQELQSFSYSVSHDLRAPLRGIDGWSQALMEDYGHRLDEKALKHLGYLRAETLRMGRLIDDLLELSRVARAEMIRERVDLTGLAHAVAARLRKREPDRQVELIIQPELAGYGDPRLIEILLTNLFGNAWKFTSKHPTARIELGRLEKDDGIVYYVRDDGAGFDMAYAKKLFGPFQRLHVAREFPGSGIGLATVKRIVQRHGGRVWAEAEVEQGATIFFTLE